MTADPPSITRAILLDVGQTPRQRVDKLLPLVYEHLRVAARGLLREERANHTLQPTALVHEAFVKLVGTQELPWESSAHFFAAASVAMRRILVDHARSRTTAKRGGKEARLAAAQLDGLPDPSSPEQAAGFLELDDAIERLQQVDPAAANVVHLRYYAGLSVNDTASALHISTATVKRTWAFARSWLRDAIGGET